MNTELSSASVASAKIIQLRELLAEKFPVAAGRSAAHWETGIAPLDAALGGGLWKGGIVEVVGEQLSAGGSSLVRGLLGTAANRGTWSALIDGVDCFDPQSVESQALRRLLWLRCHSAAEAMQSADLLLRDGNVPLVFLDLRSNPTAELRKVASQSWYRLQRILEPTATAFLALTPYPLIPCADARLGLQAEFSLATLEAETATALGQIEMRVLRKRRPGQGTEREEALLEAV